MGKSYLLLFLIFCGGSPLLRATHNRAGEITIRQIGDLTLEVTVTTYTKTTSVQADRDSVRVFWGDGSSQYVFRTNGNGTPLPNNRKLNYYTAIHTYPGRATYTISMMDPNRNGGILNVNPPNSEGVPFYIEATYTFLNPQFQGYNDTPVLLEPPIHYACVGKRFIHNPSAYDAEGDSLAFELVIPMQDSGQNVPNYIFPQHIGAGPFNSLTLNPFSGDLVWQSPQIAGEYNIAFRIKEYRNGILISSFIRDMQILVLVCDNSPPMVSSIEDVCIIAGQTLSLIVSVSDPDTGQLVALTATGGPFEVSGNKAILEAGPGGFQAQPFQALFIWTPQCEHIRDQPYTVIFKAVDNDFDTTGLVDHHAIRIKVIGPPPEDLALSSVNEAFHLSWGLPYKCDATAGDYFRGFSVWKRTGSNQFELDSCETGLEGRGYTRILANWKGMQGGRYHYEDSDIESEGSYCYRVLAEFAQVTPSGQPYLRVVSIPSDEICLRAKADRPLITKVSVDATSDQDGIIRVHWLGPDREILDTLTFPGPYQYQIMQATGVSGNDFMPVPGGMFTSPDFAGLTDSMILISNLDTRNTGYTYRIDFQTGNGNELYGSSQEASSVYLNALPSDEAAVLSWTFNVPWDNYRFDIWRSDQGGAFSLIANTTDDNFKDNGLINGLPYCYKVIAYGDYGLASVSAPLINHSQEICLVPQDNVAPCPPTLKVINICDQASSSTPADAFINYVSWERTCHEDDVEVYLIYYSEYPGAAPILAGTVYAPTQQFEHKPGEKIAGCYMVTAIDLNGNISAASSTVCVNNCPVFELPNAFTPNGDGQNDVFRPFRSRFIEVVDFRVFNRWGQVIFATRDPQINWRGQNQSGTDVSDGVYYYTCEAFESQGQTPIILSGFIELIRG